MDASPDSLVGRNTSIWTTHLRTVAWLCWLLWQRRWKRQGSLNRDLGVLAAFLAVVAGCLSFVLALGLGWAYLPGADPDAVLLAWAGLIAAFVFMRLIGVAEALRQGEGLPLDNLLHLPFSLHQVFLLNFVFSQLTLTTVIFVPAFLGLALAATVALDVRNFVLIPASLSLVVCVAAVMYQVQEWIMSAIGTKRRRVLIGYFVCTVLVGVAQTSYIVYRTQQVASEPEVTDATTTSSETSDQGVPPDEADEPTREETGLSVEWLSRGWVARRSVDGQDRFPWLSVIGMAGLLAITILILWRGHRDTLARYRQGQTGSARPRVGSDIKGRSVRSRRVRASPVAAIALVTIKHWIRSVRGVTESMPTLVMLVVFGFIWLQNPGDSDPYWLPLTVIGIASMFCAPMELASNLFGFDGRGFRVYRLAGVPARTLLLGKYLALLPLFILLAGAVLTLVAVLESMLPTHILGTVLQGGIVILACCLMGGALSMSSPHAVSPTSTTHRGGCATGFLILMMKLAMTALLVLVAWLAIALERHFAEDGHAFPVYLVVSMIEFGLSIVAFRALLGRQARQLVERSDHILDAVTVTD